MTSNTEDADFSTFMRYFCTRMVQAVVQARMGKMQPTLCSPGAEQRIWFNLIIDEIGEVAAYLKSTIGKNYPPNISTLSLEFILNTADGDQLPLETWIVRIDKECCDGSVNIRTTLYQQMSTLLKSIIMAARFTPVYRYYVKNQGPETFVIIYRVFEGEPDLTILGDEIKFKRLGYLPSPFGTLTVELHYRTKMEIQPQPYTDCAPAIGESGAKMIPLGVAVPAEGSQVVAVSPTSAENINIFSTSPISQDLPFRAKTPNFTIGRSYSSADAMDQKRANHAKSDLNQDQPTASPPTSSSFPQRNSLQNPLRMRNNSFPFASLLLYSQSSSDQLVKTLPNVPEDAALNTAMAAPDNGERAKNYSNGQELRRNSSTGIEIVAFSGEPNLNPLESCSKNSDQQGSTTAHVLFRCSSNNQEEEEENQPDKGKEGAEEEDREGHLSGREENNNDMDSDDSFVKVMAFAGGGPDEDLGTDLGEFLREVKLAPENLRSFSQERAVDLEKQLDEYKQKSSGFAQFVADIRQKGEGTDEEE